MLLNYLLKILVLLAILLEPAKKEPNLKGKFYFDLRFDGSVN